LCAFGCVARQDVRAPLRWGLALAAVGTLGFFAGRYVGRDEPAPTFQLTLPVTSTAGPAPASAAPAVAAKSAGQVPATVHEIMRLPSDFTQSAALHVLAAGADRQGIERLLDEAETIGRESERRAATNILYQRFAELDPEAAVAHVLARPAGFDPNWLYGTFYVWARTDLDGAIAHAAQLDEQKRVAAGTAIVRSRDDLSRSEREAVVAQLDVQVAVRDPSNLSLNTPQAAERAWHGALALTDDRQRQQEMYNIVHAWAQQDPRAAIRAIEAYPKPGERDNLLAHAVGSWAKKDAREALGWVLDQPSSARRASLLSSALGTLAARDPPSAMAVVEKLPPAEQQQVMSDVLMYWASRDGPAAGDWALNHVKGQMSEHAVQMVVMVFGHRKPDEAYRWATTLPEEHRSMVMGQIIQQVAQSDFDRASNMISQMEEGQHRRDAIQAVASNMAASDPRAALNWIAKQPSSDVTPDVYGGIFGQWAPYDLDAAVSQLNFMLDAEHRDGAIQGILNTDGLDPDLCDQLYQRINGVDAKQMAAQAIYYRLSGEDPHRAERYRLLGGLPLEQGAGN
jgi:hypothetical protein